MGRDCRPKSITLYTFYFFSCGILVQPKVGTKQTTWLRNADSRRCNNVAWPSRQRFLTFANQGCTKMPKLAPIPDVSAGTQSISGVYLRLPTSRRIVAILPVSTIISMAWDFRQARISSPPKFSPKIQKRAKGMHGRTPALTDPNLPESPLKIFYALVPSRGTRKAAPSDRRICSV